MTNKMCQASANDISPFFQCFFEKAKDEITDKLDLFLVSAKNKQTEARIDAICSENNASVRFSIIYI